ncbi:hypothetical protein D3C74_374660 [compost metagenome]
MFELIEASKGDIKISQTAVRIDVGIIMEIEKQILCNAAASFVIGQRLNRLQAVIGVLYHIRGQVFVIGDSPRYFLKFIHPVIYSALHLVKLIDI